MGYSGRASWPKRSQQLDEIPVTRDKATGELLRSHELPWNVMRIGAWWCIMHNMADTNKAVRQSVSLPGRIARRVRALAKKEKASANRVLVDLIEAGLESKEAEKQRFFTLANRLGETTDTQERKRLKRELAHMTFGE
jgi:hypothetical protein